MNKKTGFNVSYIVLAIAGVFVLHSLILSATRVEEIGYDQFQSYLSAKKVKEVVISDRHLEGIIQEPDGKEWRVASARVEGDLAKELGQHGIKFRLQIESTFMRDLLSWVLPVLLFVGIWMFVGRRLAGGMGGGFQSRRYSEETAREIDCSVRKIVDKAHSRAVQILERNHTLLEEGARDLLVKETMPEQDLKALFSRVQACDGAAA